MQQGSEERISQEAKIRDQKRKERRKRQMKRRRTIFFSCIALLLVVVVFAAGKALLFRGDGGGGHTADIGDGADKPDKPAEPIELTISCVGDIMVHKSQLTAQYNSATDSYSFDDNFQYVKKYIEAADLALCNVETTFGGGAYSGYPAFNSPESLADAISNAGFDAAITSNNHMMDTGFKGMQRTIEVLRGAGLPVTGSKLAGEDKSYIIADVKGVKVAVVSYTYETPGVNGRRTINGNPLSDEAKSCINSFSYNSLDNDLAALKADIDSARGDGAQVVIVYFHWGEEYQRTPNDWQQRIARRAAEMGADAIFASHPHVLQGVEMLKITEPGADDGQSGDTADGTEDSIDNSQDGGSGSGQGDGGAKTKKVPVFYSLGNFLSNQRRETLNNNAYTEQGLIASVHLTYHPDSGELSDVSMDAMPTWLDKYTSGGRTYYAIVPLDAELEQNPALSASGHLSRAQQAQSEIKGLLGL